MLWVGRTAFTALSNQDRRDSLRRLVLGGQGPRRERVFYWQPTGSNPLHHRDDYSGPALRHGSLNFLFQVAFYSPSSHLEMLYTFLSLAVVDFVSVNLWWGHPRGKHPTSKMTTPLYPLVFVNLALTLNVVEIWRWVWSRKCWTLVFVNFGVELDRCWHLVLTSRSTNDLCQQKSIGVERCWHTSDLIGKEF